MKHVDALYIYWLITKTGFLVTEDLAEAAVDSFVECNWGGDEDCGNGMWETQG